MKTEGEKNSGGSPFCLQFLHLRDGHAEYEDVFVPDLIPHLDVCSVQCPYGQGSVGLPVIQDNNTHVMIVAVTLKLADLVDLYTHKTTVKISAEIIMVRLGQELMTIPNVARSVLV